jgi:UDP-N-acetylglucosamine 2-epimerase (non-hydrolysing)
MKIAPIVRALKQKNGNIGQKAECCKAHKIGIQNKDFMIETKIVHTGQHYDNEMSKTFFDDLELPPPDFFLNAGSGTHAEQTAKIMIAFEKICTEEKPDWVMLVGDVNSTLACAVVAKKACIQTAHVEAGLRSGDMSMPEEINRMVTDAISDLYFVTERSGVENLLREGKRPDQIHFVGHVMVDNLFFQVKRLKHEDTSRFAVSSMKREKDSYAFLTLHRPSNVDDRKTFEGIALVLNRIAEQCPIFFPVHPRTRKQLKAFDIRLSDHITVLPPLGFREALFLLKDADFVLTDSGGLQEETTALGIPCLTFRENTERPITVQEGTNTLIGTNPEHILSAFTALKNGGAKKGKIPNLWDGHAAERIVDVLLTK